MTVFASDVKRRVELRFSFALNKVFQWSRRPIRKCIENYETYTLFSTIRDSSVKQNGPKIVVKSLFVKTVCTIGNKL